MPLFSLQVSLGRAKKMFQPPRREFQECAEESVGERKDLSSVAICSHFLPPGQSSLSLSLSHPLNLERGRRTKIKAARMTTRQFT